MNRHQQNAIAALAAAGVLWGLTVPLSKLSLAWLSPAWLTAARFAIAAPALGLVARRRLRPALRPDVAISGALGFGLTIILQNAGIERTSVGDAAVIVGVVPVLVAVLAAAMGNGRLGPRRWAGNLVALAGVALVAGLGGGGALLGDGLVFASCILSAGFVVTQPRRLAGRDAAAVTAVQFGAAGLIALPIALLLGGAPRAPAGAEPVVAFTALALAGTVLPFWLFASAQARVRAEIAGAYLNLEPVVGAAVGWLGFGNGAAPIQIAGVVLVLAGIAVATLASAERRAGERRSARKLLESLARWWPPSVARRGSAWAVKIGL